ncbi:MAG: twin-arginine translocase TatA/TatE family subunit [Anaerolineae bacterium]|nr:twin-arginine translocase TatA/TatE family subunit [Anaerolineae bacterium]
MLPQLGVPELLIILVIIIIIFGVGRLPEIGGAIGKSIREFRKAQQPDELPPAAPEAEKQQKEEQTEAK